MRLVRVVISLLILALPWGAPHSAAGQESLGTDDLWWDGFTPHGAVGPLDAITDSDITGAVVYEGDLLVAGNFRFMDGVPVSGLARWTGTTWEPFDGTGLPRYLTTIAVYRGDLIVGGLSGVDDTAPESCLHRWTGTEWEPFGPDDPRAVHSQIEQLKVAGDHLYAILFEYGDFDPDPYFHRIVTRWNGTAWEEIGFWRTFLELGDHAPQFLDVDEFRGDPVVATIDPLNRPDDGGCVYRWNGSEPELLGEGVNGPVASLCVYDDRLFAAGDFDSTGSRRTGPVAAWNGSSWEGVGEDLETIWGKLRLSALFSSDDHLYAYGNVRITGGQATGPLLIWTGSGWAPSTWYFSDNLDHGSPGCLIEYEGKVFYGGEIDLGAHYFQGMATWDGEQWLPFPARPVELVDEPTALLPTEEGLVAAGRFTLPGFLVSTRGIARWDGATWTFLAEAVNGTVYDLAEYDGRLVAGGSFYRIDGTETESVAELTDGRWKQIGNGFEGVVTALEVYDGRLVAGGYEMREDGSPLELIAAWNGLAWEPLGPGLHGEPPCRVMSLETYGGKLIAAGAFTSAGGVDVENIASWDGRTWSAVGPPGVFSYKDTGHVEYIEQLHTWRGRLYARGWFDRVLGEPADRVAVWNGESWSPFDNPLVGRIEYIGGNRDRLIIGGRLLRTEDDPWYPSLVLFDGKTWYTLGSSITRGVSSQYSGTIVTTTAEWRDNLYVGGTILTAGDKLSFFMARWDGTGLVPPPAPRLRAAPNPAVESSAIEFRLDGPGHTAVHVFDVQGRRIRTLADEFMTGGDHTATWDLRDGGGRRVPAGVYFLRVASPFSTAARKVVVIR